MQRNLLCFHPFDDAAELGGAGIAPVLTAEEATDYNLSHEDALLPETCFAWCGCRACRCPEKPSAGEPEIVD